jgi:hypothetical protein
LNSLEELLAVADRSIMLRHARHVATLDARSATLRSATPMVMAVVTALAG